MTILTLLIGLTLGELQGGLMNDDVSYNISFWVDRYFIYHA